MTMDSGARVYASLLNGITLHLSKLDPKLNQTALKEGLTALDKAGVRYSTDGGVLTVTDAGEQSRKALYDFALAYVSAFEGEHGVNETWSQLKSLTLKTLQNFRDDVRRLNLEIPIVKYVMGCVLLENLFGFKSSDFRNRRWIEGPVLVTNHSLVFPKEKGEEVVPLQIIATVCREIYVGYSAKVTKGVIRAIDYQVKAAGMSCVVVLAREEVMGEFRKVVSMLRAEQRRLGQGEARVLLALNKDTPLDQLAKASGLSQAEADDALRRLFELKYTDKGGHLTSYGINAAVELRE